MIYADYCYYSGTYYGDVVSEDEFPKCASRASEYIDYITGGKAKNNADLPEVKKCCCALAEQYLLIDSVRKAASAKVTSDGIIASETVGSHSRTFRSGVDGANAVSETENELGNIARRYLLPTGLLYRGGVSCVHTARSNTL